MQEKIIASLMNQLDLDRSAITMESRFIEDFSMDSLDMVELVMGLEEEFEIQIPDEDAEKVTTVKQAVDYIDQNGEG